MLRLFRSKTPNEPRSRFEAEALPHLDALHAYALRLTRDDATAADLVQDTFVKALRFYDKYEEGTNCKAWLFRVMTNLFLNSLRNRARIAVLEDESTPGVDLEASEAVAGQGFYRDTDAQALDRIVSKNVEEALGSLSPEFRTVLLLADLHDMTYEEIAEIVECPVGTVMSRLYRARKAMQSRLYDHALKEGIIRKQVETTSEGVPSLDAFRRRRKVGTGSAEAE